MGKKNRVKSKKSKSRNSMPGKMTLEKEDTEDSLVLLKLQSNKENFLHNLKQYSSKLLNEFELCIEARIESNANVTVRFKPPKISSSFLNFDTRPDLTNETFEIFSKVFRKFADSLIRKVSEDDSFIDAKNNLQQAEKLKVRMQDGLKIIEIFLQEISSYSNHLFGISDSAFKGFSIDLLKQQAKLFFNVEDLIMSLGFWQSYEYECKVWEKLVIANKLKKNFTAESDLIVQNFQRKLDLEVVLKGKERPALSDEWISDLKKLIKCPRCDLGYI